MQCASILLLKIYRPLTMCITAKLFPTYMKQVYSKHYINWRSVCISLNCMCIMPAMIILFPLLYSVFESSGTVVCRKQSRHDIRNKFQINTPSRPDPASKTRSSVLRQSGVLQLPSLWHFLSCAVSKFENRKPVFGRMTICFGVFRTGCYMTMRGLLSFLLISFANALPQFGKAPHFLCLVGWYFFRFRYLPKGSGPGSPWWNTHKAICRHHPYFPFLSSSE